MAFQPILYGRIPDRIRTAESAPGSLTRGVLYQSMSDQAADLAAQGGSPQAGVLAPQGQFSQAAYGLAGAPRMPLPAGAGFGGGAYLPAMEGGGSSDPTENGKFKGAASGAAAGANFGPYGALVGGVLGYAGSGGAKDLNPIDASGFSGISMEQAWKDQNLARLGSNPAAALAAKAGISEKTVLGHALKALDPTSVLGGIFRSKKGDEKRNLNAFLQEVPLTDAGNGMYTLPDGVKINADQLQHLAGTWYGATYAPDGDQAGWQDKYNEALQEIYSQPMYFGD
jgi:hypothetical protein